MGQQKSINRSGVARTAGLTAIAALLLCLTLASPASASKGHLFLETFGSAATPNYIQASGAAVDPASGDVLVVDIQPQEQNKIYRFHADGTPSPFPALGTHVIDAKKGPGGKPCAEEAASCDLTPQEGFLDSLGGELSGFGLPAQIAIDDSGTLTDGNIYAAQPNARLIDVFAADGHYLGQITSFGAKKLGTPTSVAVDAAGALYVADRSRNAIHKFVPSAVVPQATDYVEAQSLTIPDPFQIALGAGPSAGSIFVLKFSTIEGRVSKYDLATRTLKYVVAENSTLGGSKFSLSSEAVDPETGRLLLVQEGDNPRTFTNDVKSVVDTYDVSGATEATVLAHTDPTESSGGLRFSTSGLAVGDGRLYFPGESRVQVYDTAISTLPEPLTGTASGIGSTKATLNGTVDPDGVELSECSFEYGLADANGLVASYDGSAPCAESPAEIGSGTSPVAVHADASGLTPNTKYGFRLVVANSETEAANPEPQAKGFSKSFTTLNAYVLAVTKQGSGTGTVTSGPTGISCGSVCSAPFDKGAEVTLEATPGEGSTFTGWSGSGCSGIGTCVVTMSEAREVTASFEEEAKEEGIPFTVALEGTGSGTVTSDKGAISCNPFCTDEYEAGTVVTLTATPTPGSIFYSWRYCDAGGVNGRQCTVTLDKAKTVKATFTTTHALEVSKAPGSGLGKVQSSPGGVLCLFNCTETTAAFREGTEVTLKQTPAKHFHFVEWLGDCTGSGPCQVTMGEDHEVQAKFAEDPKHLLTLTKSGGGAGTVKSSVAGINCGAVCSEQASAYYQGEVVELTSTSGKGSTFGGWTGCDSEPEGRCLVTIEKATEVEAEFE